MYSLWQSCSLSRIQRQWGCQGPALEPGTLGNLGQFVQSSLGGVFYAKTVTDPRSEGLDAQSHLLHRRGNSAMPFRAELGHKATVAPGPILEEPSPWNAG